MFNSQLNGYGRRNIVPDLGFRINNLQGYPTFERLSLQDKPDIILKNTQFL